MKRILIIEDDPLISRVYSTKYQSAGFGIATRVAIGGGAPERCVSPWREAVPARGLAVNALTPLR